MLLSKTRTYVNQSALVLFGFILSFFLNIGSLLRDILSITPDKSSWGSEIWSILNPYFVILVNPTSYSIFSSFPIIGSLWTDILSTPPNKWWSNLDILLTVTDGCGNLFNPTSDSILLSFHLIFRDEPKYSRYQPINHQEFPKYR